MREQKVSYPCIRFDGQGIAIKKILPSSVAVNVYDINRELEDVYEKRLGVKPLPHENSGIEYFLTKPIPPPTPNPIECKTQFKEYAHMEL